MSKEHHTMTTTICADANCNEVANDEATKTQGLNIYLCAKHGDVYQKMSSLQASIRQTYRHNLGVIGEYPGFTYVLEFEGEGPLEGLVKVGMSRDERTLANRIRTHRNKYPAEFEVVAVYRGGSATEHYFKEHLLEELAVYGDQRELYFNGPALWDVMGDLDQAGVRAWDVQAQYAN